MDDENRSNGGGGGHGPTFSLSHVINCTCTAITSLGPFLGRYKLLSFEHNIHNTALGPFKRQFSAYLQT